MHIEPRLCAFPHQRTYHHVHGQIHPSSSTSSSHFPVKLIPSQLRDILLTECANAKDSVLHTDALSWLNRVTLDIIGLTGQFRAVV